MRLRLAGLGLIWAAVLLAAPAEASGRHAVRPGFDRADLSGQTILLLRPALWLGARSVGGVDTPDAEGTDLARAQITSELRAQLDRLGLVLIDPPAALDAGSTTLDEHGALLGMVADALTEGELSRRGRLPTHPAGSFAWTVGPGLAGVAALTGARLGLFVSTRDAFGSTGRKAYQLLAGGLFGLPVGAGEHRGHAALVDLRSGNLIWFNTDESLGGDPRSAAGVRKRVAQLLAAFPGAHAGAGR